MKTTPQSLPQAIQATFASSSYIGLRHLKVDLVDNVVIVSGKVRSHYLKQIARTIAHSIAPNQEIRFALAVNEDEAIGPGGRRTDETLAVTEKA